VTAVKIDSVLHEFSTIKGVKEDVTDVRSQPQQLIVKMHSDEPKFIHIDVSKKARSPRGTSRRIPTSRS